MTGTDWRGDENRPPRLGRKGRGWLRRRIVAILFKHDDKDEACPYLGNIDQVRWSKSCISMLLDEYMANPSRYAHWHDSATYHGSGFSNGSWVVDEEAVKLDFDKHATVVDRDLDAEHCESLDDWLRLDREGKLWYDGDPGGMRFVGDALRQRTAEAAQRRRLTKTCSCGKRFVGKKRNSIHCDECVERLKSERAIGQQHRGRSRG